MSLEKGSQFLPLQVFRVAEKIVCQKYRNFIKGDPYKLGWRPLGPKKIIPRRINSKEDEKPLPFAPLDL